VNRDIFEGQWKQMREQIRDWWGELSAADLDGVAGNFDQFIGLLQEKYGYSRQRAEEEFYRRMALLREIRVEVEAQRRLGKNRNFGSSGASTA
jgi:uncharacterized protein YjbJ (UPF0337 family)